MLWCREGYVRSMSGGPQANPGSSPEEEGGLKLREGLYGQRMSFGRAGQRVAASWRLRSYLGDTLLSLVTCDGSLVRSCSAAPFTLL